ncbi:MAG: hypothetical protein ACK6DP_17450 [Gemmatimonas sp.]|uniref:hypothetical protein n=1 Tax=Gemmatimonas sp. TaxID=1962908 RepID=UPI00391F51CB
MDEPSPAGTESTEPSLSVAAPPPKSFARRHWLALPLLVLLGLPLLGLTAWTAIALNWSYSTGKRAGYVQKFSRKGFVCKTWEGTLYTDIAKGFRSDSFSFTVRDDSVAHVLESLSGRKVAVEYEQHLYVPTSCFGETEYFVTGVQEIPE